jgi:hypothetical protein
VLTLRDEGGHRTDDAKMLRAFSGLRESEQTTADRGSTTS